MVPDIRALLRPLVRPRAALADDPPDSVDGILLVALAGVLVAGSLPAAGLVLGSTVPGTGTLPTPDKPPAWQCDEPVGGISTPDECGPRTPSRSTSASWHRTASSRPPLALLAGGAYLGSPLQLAGAAGEGAAAMLLVLAFLGVPLLVVAGVSVAVGASTYLL